MRGNYDIFLQHIDKRHSVRNERETLQLLDMNPFSIIVTRKHRGKIGAFYPKGVHPDAPGANRIKSPQTAKFFQIQRKSLKKGPFKALFEGLPGIENRSRELPAPRIGPPLNPLTDKDIFAGHGYSTSNMHLLPFFQFFAKENTTYLLF